MMRIKYYYLLILGIVAIDHLTKFMIVANLSQFQSITIIPGFFKLVHVKNNGAVFGFLSNSGKPWVFTVLTIVSSMALLLVIYYFHIVSAKDKVFKFALALILAGALGNLIDRIIRGYVVDFLHFYVKKWQWPSFNLADSCITIGAIILLYIFFIRKKETCIQSS
ncbi:MAG: signal peptidase II [Candidatus Aminicenantes bacterium]|nr:signal peptidase II [Candidatus Aminicenantes bacterium]